MEIMRLKEYIAKYKFWIFIIFLSMLALVFIPIIIINFFVLIPWNQLMPIAKADWVSVSGSYVGAIIGGFVSGFITLAGVILTIKHSENMREIDEIKKTMPFFYLRVHEVLDTVDENTKIVYKIDSSIETLNQSILLKKLEKDKTLKYKDFYCKCEIENIGSGAATSIFSFASSNTNRFIGNIFETKSGLLPGEKIQIYFKLTSYDLRDVFKLKDQLKGLNDYKIEITSVNIYEQMFCQDIIILLDANTNIFNENDFNIHCSHPKIRE